MADPRVIIDAPTGLFMVAAGLAAKELAAPRPKGVCGRWRTCRLWRTGEHNWMTWWGRNDTLYVQHGQEVDDV